MGPAPNQPGQLNRVGQLRNRLRQVLGNGLLRLPPYPLPELTDRPRVRRPRAIPRIPEEAHPFFRAMR
eukprot:3294590-Alexandrium_andersonii.AAC.1